ncbi:MAG: hypothetical protein WB992_02635 [Bryobacteraceae bacterium]
MIHNLKFPISAVAGIMLIASAGCNTAPTHPNQKSAFDGATYDSLTLAHGALSSLRVQIATKYPQYSPVFNEAAAAYSAAFNAYGLNRTDSSKQAGVSVEISNLVVSIIALENTFVSDLQVSPKVILSLRQRALKIRAAAAPAITISDILTELEIAAAIAEAVPPAAEYAALASMVFEATQQALAAESAASGQLIDLSTIEPISAIQ